MRFMLMTKADQTTEAGLPPAPEYLAAMNRGIEAMAKAGVLLAAGALRPSAAGARVRFAGGKPMVTDGPFTEVKELIAGFALIQVRSKAEAVEWAKRFPLPPGGDAEIEVRQLVEPADLGGPG